MHLVSKTTTKKHSGSHNTYLLYNNQISKITPSTTTAKGYVWTPKWVYLVTCIAYEYIFTFFQPFVWLSPQEWSMRQKKSSSLERHVASNEGRHTGQPQKSWERSVRTLYTPLKVQKKHLWIQQVLYTECHAIKKLNIPLPLCGEDIHRR